MDENSVIDWTEKIGQIMKEIGLDYSGFNHDGIDREAMLFEKLSEYIGNDVDLPTNKTDLILLIRISLVVGMNVGFVMSSGPTKVKLGK